MQSHNKGSGHLSLPINGKSANGIIGTHASRDDLTTDPSIGFEDEADTLSASISGQSEKHRRRKRKVSLLLLVLFIAAVALTIWGILGGDSQKKINLRVGETRSRESETSRSPDDQTAEAIAEARSAAGSSATKITSPSSSLSEGSDTSTSATAPVTSSIDSAGDTVVPVTEVPIPPDESITNNGSSSPAADKSSPSRASENQRVTSPQRNSERSIRCALSLPSPALSITQPVSLPPQLRAEPPSPSARIETSVVKPPFGLMLPVRTLGALYTLRQGSLARFELTRDVRGEGWIMRKGTVLVGLNRGSEYDRAYIAVVGFIDPESRRLVKLNGEVLGSDGGAGLRGRRHRVSGRWSRALSRVGASAIGVAGTLANSLGRGPVIIAAPDSYRLADPVTSEISGLLAERTDRQQGFVEVDAGTVGFVMVTDLPDEIRGVDSFSEISESDLAARSDVTTKRAATGLSDKELAEVIASGSPEQIRAALPRMTPEMRRIAEAVLAESRD